MDNNQTVHTPQIEIIGTGNVGTHLMCAFAGEADVNAVPSRTLTGLRRDSDFYIICVSDAAIADVAASLAGKIPGNAVIAHTSGASCMSVLDTAAHPHTGVCYPLQTFTKGKKLDYSRIPFFIEGSDPESASRLEELARMASDVVLRADSAKRRELHVGSVFACNFVNHMWTLSSDYLASKGIDFKLLLPLIEETFGKIREISPRDAQTGPAIRRDANTIAAHTDMLSEYPLLKKIYNLLTDSIIESAD